MNINAPLQFYPSHYNPRTNEFQPNSVHLRMTGEYGRKQCRHPLLTNMVEFAGITHDLGKQSNKWRLYFEACLNNVYGSWAKEDHSTAGGQIVDELIPKTAASVMIQTAIYSHHGLLDCISVETDETLLDQRKRKAESLPIDECRNSFYTEFDVKEIKDLAEKSKEDALKLIKEIKTKMRQWENENVTMAGSPDRGTKFRLNSQMDRYGSRNFYLGMFERMLMSLLIDADRRNTEDFMTGEDAYPALEEAEIQKVWVDCADHLEEYIAKRFPDTTGMNQYKKEISLGCKEAACKEPGRYLLSVPTGAGKTLSSLRFAVHHAKRYRKSRIIYVAPYRSITEQNAEEIRKALGRPDIVLEHHSSILPEDESDQNRYDRITEDWQVPVIVTTAVQFLNTIFAGKTGNVRRFHSLCDSVIIMDEVQALPIRVLGLFDLAMNFLTEFAGATVVLCTATQPLLGDLPENRLLPARQMVLGTEKYDEQFRRTEIIDETELTPGGMEADGLARYILNKAEEYQSVLFIGNTKNCVRVLYEKIVDLCGSSEGLWHLSTNMVPASRQEVLKEIKMYSDAQRSSCQRSDSQDSHKNCDGLGERKKEGVRRICISTQLIEAGVDVSFNCVIRSLAGLDSVIQAAGRCNRYRDIPMGRVFVVNIGKTMEDISSLPDIYKAQDAMKTVLRQYRKAPDTLDGRLDSRKAIELYYQYYFIKRESEMAFPVTINEVPTTLVRLLSGNEDQLGPDRKAKNTAGVERNKMGRGSAAVPQKGSGTGRPILLQAFKQAGEKFCVIDEGETVDLIVELDDAVKEKIEQLGDMDTSLNDKKRLMRELQLYTVSVSPQLLDKLEPGIRRIWDGRVLILDRRYYNDKTGITKEPKPMEFLGM